MLIFSLVIFQLIIFSFLIFILKKIMTKNVISATQHLDELNKEYLKKQQQIEERIKQIEEQAKTTILQAQEEAERLKAQIIQEVESQRDRMIEEARTQAQEIIEQAEKSRQVLISEIEERINKEAIQKACDLIRDTLPQDFKEAVHHRWVEELIQEGFEELSRLNVYDEINEVEIVCAFPLTEKQKKIITEKLRGLLKKDLLIKERIEPSIVAGIVVNLGSLVLDGSLRFKIKEAALKTNT